jgi:outer membrane protein OmpA-like peptidoglycan-associated protein
MAQTNSTELNSKWDLFGTYQWQHPGGKVPAHLAPVNPTAYQVPDMIHGFGASLTYNFFRHVGAEADFGRSWGQQNGETTVSVGPRFRWSLDGVNFFAHGLASYNRLSVGTMGISNAPGAIVGGGMDIPLGKRFAWRVFDADYVWAYHNFDVASLSDAKRNLNGVRLRTGVGYNWGGMPEAVPAVSCAVNPAAVTVGERVTVTATPGNFDPRHKLTYSWSGNGVVGKEETASIDTANLAPGTYTVKATASDLKKKNKTASCSTQFTVKALPPKNPPVMTCSARPASVAADQLANVSCDCSSPDNVPVSVGAWKATAGTISGNGNTATLDPRGATPGAVTVSATCTDSRGLTQSASTQITVEKPVVSPAVKQLEARLALHSVYFPTAQPTAKNPKAGLVASQQRTLQNLASDFKQYLQAKPDAQLTLEGHADVRGSVSSNAALSERRVARVKNFLVANGVSESRIATKAFGAQHNLSAAEVKASVEGNTDLSSADRARLLRNTQTIVWASNRRVDITLNNAGQTENSVKRFPFNAADSLTLLGDKKASGKTKGAKKATHKAKHSR